MKVQVQGIGMIIFSLIVAVGLMMPGESLAILGLFEEGVEHKEAHEPVPPEYQGKQIPVGWVSDPKVLAAGKDIYDGNFDPEVTCVDCHGIDGKPTRKGRGSPDFTDPAEAHEPDALWFWRVSDGKRKTKMRGYKQKLTEDQRWQVIAYIRSLTKK